MDFYRNVTVSGDHHQQDQVLSTNPPCSSKLANPLDDLFSAHNTEVDVSLEWLSIFVEDCLSCSGICLPASELPNKNVQNNATTTTDTAPKSPKPLEKQTTFPLSLGKISVPGKARSKRKRAASSSSSGCKKSQINSLTSWTHNLNNKYNPDTQLFHSDPPLLQQAYWLADSELIVPKKVKANEEDAKEEVEEEVEANNVQQQPRRCSHCLAQRTPQWRAGPLGPKTLCNACGVRYKSGRLLPEYRPAKSPTFVSNLHSNSHKKVLEMRMALMMPSQLPK